MHEVPPLTANGFLESLSRPLVQLSAPSVVGGGVDRKPQRDFVDCKWISNRTGWSDRTIRRMARQRQIPGASHQGHGGHWRFKRSVVLAWLASAT